jgi:CRP-like cAMP-binding protein
MFLLPVGGCGIARKAQRQCKSGASKNANDCLFHEGDKSDGVYLVKRGALRLSLEASPGKTVMNRVVGLGYVVGLPA